jgi:hypothetical protein
LGSRNTLDAAVPAFFPVVSLPDFFDIVIYS